MAKFDPIAAVFAEYKTFDYDKSRSSVKEFERLATFNQWGRKNKAKKAAYKQLQTAATEEFNTIIGTNIEDINVWQSLCVLLQIDPIPDTIGECRKKVKSVFVNIADLVEAVKKGKKSVKQFPNEQALSNYTLNGKIFPLDRAKAGGVLKYLLRQIRRPRPTVGVKRRR